MKPNLPHSILVLLLVGLLFSQCKKDDPAPPKSTEKSLTSPAISGLSSATVAYEAITYTYTITVPFGTDVTALKLGFTLPSSATVKPVLGSVQNFTTPVVYTVTAEDGTTQNYIIKVVVAKSPEKQIVDFKFNSLSPIVSSTIDQTTHKISATVLAGTNLTALAPAVAVSSKATVSPASGQTQDFNKPVTYTVTAEDGSTQTYEVTLTKSTYYIDDADYTLKVDVNGDKLILTSTSKKGIGFSPKFMIDVNLNGNLDPNVDRSYGYSTAGDFCASYLIDYRSTTYCGISPSNGTFSKSTNGYIFSIPLSELLPTAKDTVSIILSMYNIPTGTYLFYPANPPQDNTSYFKNSFLIKIR